MTTSAGSRRPERRQIDVAAGVRVSAEIDRAATFRPDRSPGLVLGHGAGNDMHHPLLIHVCRRLVAELELLCLRFNFPYREAGWRAPDPQARLEAAYAAALASVRGSRADRPGAVFAGGKSLGARIASHLAAAGEPLAGLVFLGYPLHPAGKPDRPRDAHLPRIRCPMLFVQGSRDRLCDLDLLHPVLARLSAPVRLHVIEGGDHSFAVPRRSGRTAAAVLDEIATTVRDWMREILADGAAP